MLKHVRRKKVKACELGLGFSVLTQGSTGLPVDEGEVARCRERPRRDAVHRHVIVGERLDQLRRRWGDQAGFGLQGCATSGVRRLQLQASAAAETGARVGRQAGGRTAAEVARQRRGRDVGPLARSWVKGTRLQHVGVARAAVGVELHGGLAAPGDRNALAVKFTPSAPANTERGAGISLKFKPPAPVGFACVAQACAKRARL